MNISKTLQEAVSSQDIEANLEDICFNLFLKTGTIFPLSFYVDETETTFTLVTTTEEIREEIRIVPKENIEYFALVYDIKIDKEQIQDRMFE